MVFDFLARTAQAAVDVTLDIAEIPLGGDGPSREDVAQLLAGGLSVWAAAEVLGVTVDVVEALAGESD